jgi:hypothetical protein
MPRPLRIDAVYAGVNQNTKEAIGDIDGDRELDIVGQDSYSSESKPWLYRNLRRN